jgi:hypothetical protein
MKGSEPGIPHLPLSLSPEASGRLVGPPVFKTGVPATSWQAGSIPVRLRWDSTAMGASRELELHLALVGVGARETYLDPVAQCDASFVDRGNDRRVA